MSTYPDPPGRRIAWDADGTTVLARVYGGTWTEQGLAYKQEWNDEDGTNLNPSVGKGNPWTQIVLIFPEARDIDGLYTAAQIYGSTSYISQVEWSTDTTDGSDGTWSSPVTLPYRGNPTSEWRTHIFAVAWSSVVGIRFTIPREGLNSGEWKCMHVYGEISAAATPDRIIFLDPDNSDTKYDQPIDLGDVGRGLVQYRTFKIKNQSPDKSINGVTIDVEALYESSDAWYTVSLDGTTYSGAITVGDMAAGATETIYVRVEIPTGENPGPHGARFVAAHTSVT